jgi:hypothetical protein
MFQLCGHAESLSLGFAVDWPAVHSPHGAILSLAH